MAPFATPVEDAARRLRRWPAAILDRRCARRPRVVQAGAEKRPPAEPRNGTAPGRDQRRGPTAAWDADWSLSSATRARWSNSRFSLAN